MGAIENTGFVFYRLHVEIGIRSYAMNFPCTFRSVEESLVCGRRLRRICILLFGYRDVEETRCEYVLRY